MAKRLIIKFINSLKGSRPAVSILLICLLLIVVTLIIGFQTAAFDGFPKGTEALGHASLLVIIRDGLPNFSWNPYWGGGQLLFPSDYPSIYHFILAIGSKILKLDIPMLMSSFAALNIMLTVIFIFGTIFFLTKKTLPSAIGSFFYLSSSVVWLTLLKAGQYPEAFSQTVLILSLFALFLYFKRVEKTEGGWSYYLVIFSFALAFISHPLTAVLATGSFFVFLLLLVPRFDDKFVLAIKIFIPVLGLTSFRYLSPIILIFSGGASLNIIKTGVYSSPIFPQIFGQTQFDFPILSMALLLLLAFLVFFTRRRMEKEEVVIWKVFWATFLIGFFGVFGFYERFLPIFGNYQILLPIILFLSLFVGLGFALLANLEILVFRSFFIVMIGFLSLALYQIPAFKKASIDESRVWKEVSFKAIDKSHRFRFAHSSSDLGEAFNFYSLTFQTGGSRLAPASFYNTEFEDAVFARNDNPQQTMFFLDWYGVYGFYSGELSRNGQNFSLKPKLSPDNFAQSGEEEWVYKRALPILTAQDTPAVLIKTDEEEYRKIISQLARENIGSQTIIPLWAEGKGQVEQKDLPVASSLGQIKLFLGGLSPSGSLGEEKGQSPTFINSQRREVEIRDKFKGVLFKESFAPDWQARIEIASSDGMLKTRDNLKIYRAGPGMMYTFLPQDYSLPAKVIFEYRLSLIEKIGILISFITLILIIISLLGWDWRGKVLKLIKLFLRLILGRRIIRD